MAAAFEKQPPLSSSRPEGSSGGGPPCLQVLQAAVRLDPPLPGEGAALLGGLRRRRGALRVLRRQRLNCGKPPARGGAASLLLLGLLLPLGRDRVPSGSLCCRCRRHGRCAGGGGVLFWRRWVGPGGIHKRRLGGTAVRICCRRCRLGCRLGGGGGGWPRCRGSQQRGQHAGGLVEAGNHLLQGPARGWGSGHADA